MQSTIIKQLEKALECKDDKEMRTRIEVLLDFLKDTPVRANWTAQPMEAPKVWMGDNRQPVRTGPPQIRGAGAIISNGEELPLDRPPGT